MSVVNAADFKGHVNINGIVSATGLDVPDETLTNRMYSTSPSLRMDGTKYVARRCFSYAQNSATTAASLTIPLFIAQAAGTIKAFECTCIGANVGAATVTFDLKKNGSSVLTGVVTVDNGDAARAVVAGTISSATYADGDVFEVTIVATAGGGTLGTGTFAQVTVEEHPA